MTLNGARIAVTGATGFVGRHLVPSLAAQGWQVRVLARSEPAHALWRDTKPEVVLGSLSDDGALERLVQGADAVLHLAGAIKARDNAEFLRINRDGTTAVAQATLRVAPKAHFLQVSSLAAREPSLSGYCASKLAGEQAHGRDPGLSLASFLFLPHTVFVAEFGLGHFELSMQAQHALTQR